MSASLASAFATAPAPAPRADRPAAAVPGAAITAAGAGRDRFLAFAFAASDLLVETTGNGVIAFATGAFPARFGVPAEQFLGRHASALIATPDQPAFALALASVEVRGRIPAMLLRLADARHSPVCVAAMLLPGADRLCLTFGPPPLAAPELAAGAAPLGDGPEQLARAAALRLGMAGRDGGGELGLVELAGWDAAKDEMSAADQRWLRREIGSALGSAGAGALASEVAEGRFGVLAQNATELSAAVEQLDRLIRSTPAGRVTRVETSGLGLASGSLAPGLAARALRFALSRFSGGGLSAARAAGAGEGLAGIIARAESCARSVQQAIAERRFRLQFQPVVDLQTAAAHHFEALIRPIVTPGTAMREPQDFVTFAEIVGLSEELDGAVLAETLGVLRQDGPAVAVNISGLSMQSPRFLAHMLDVIGQSGRAGHLMLELTETAEIEDIRAAAGSMAELRGAGVRLCLDDFGAGAAAFRYLRDFPVDYVKIDGAYVRAAPNSPRERGLIASMVELAHSVGAQVVAEMVETEEEARLVRELGVEYGQGWLFGRPGGFPGGLS